MIKIECSRCAVWIHLPFHGKEDLIECPHCAKTTPVRDIFVSDLKEMLDGCRDIVRHGMNGVKVLFTIDNRRYYGQVLNLSVSGICLEAGRTASINRLWSGAKVLLKGEKTGPFTVG